MIKIFFATIFIAELIIAIAVILKIYKLDIYVNSLNAAVTENKSLIRDGLKEFKWFLAECVSVLLRVKNIIRQKKEEYMFRAMKTSLIYACILLLKGKYKKGVLIYQFLSEVYSGFSEVEC